jgi:transposase
MWYKGAMVEQLPLSLPESRSSGTVIINAQCALRIEGEHRVVVVSGFPVHHYSDRDAVAEAYAMVFLVDSGFATQVEVARAFRRAERTIRRQQQRYAEGGMASLATRSGWRPGRRRLLTKRIRLIERLKAQGLSNCEIARRMGVTENAIRKQVGPSVPEQASQATLPLGPSAEPAKPAPSTLAPEPCTSAGSSSTNDEVGPRGSSRRATPTPEEPVAISVDTDPANRTLDRLLACFGFLDDAPPVFGNAKAVLGAGVLFALPALVASGIFHVAHTVYGEIGPAFYGLRTTLLVLLLMALWRIKRPEALKEHDPARLGRVLGLDRTPEVKTLRSKLSRLASAHRADRLGAELARLRVQQRGQLMGFLYVDGHVRVYHGKHKIPKAHVARMRLSMPATTDYWVNDQSGEPLFVVTAAANAGLVKMLPALLKAVRVLLGDRRVTVAFDRGGFSPKLFQALLKEHFDVLTYRKGKTRRISKKRFVERREKFDGRWVQYHLCDQPIRLLKGTLRLRQVTRLGEGDHQTAVLTSRWDLRDIEVAYRMFERWRQENFFKYMREEYLLDALTDYRIEADDPTRTVPNPERRALDREIRAARAALGKLEEAYGGAALGNLESRRPTMRGFKIAHGRLGKQVRAAQERLAQLLAQRRALPRRVEIQKVTEGEVIKLAMERKHLTNLLKMVAYQAESDLLALLGPRYARVEQEGRTLLHELFRASADLHVTNTEIQVTLCPLSAPHRTRAIEAICAALTESATQFPGSRVTMRFAVHPPPQIGLAFPGPRLSSTSTASRQPDISAGE